VNRLEQKLNKPMVVLIVGVAAVALNVLLYIGYQMSRTPPLNENIYSIGTSLPEAVGKSDPKARSDPEATSKTDAEASSKSGPEEPLEAVSASLSSPSPVSVPPQASASPQTSAPPPQQQSVTHSSAEVSISQDESAEVSSSIDPSSSCPYSQSKLKVPGLGCTHTTVPLPKSTSP
jgi:hypothetical protein